MAKLAAEDRKRIPLELLFFPGAIKEPLENAGASRPQRVRA